MKFSKAGRPVIMSQHGMVSSGHALASLAGVKILQEGGNAVDAALAAAFVSAVVKPETSGPGGDLFALVSMKKTGKVEALNSSGPAPAKAAIEHFQERGLKSIPQFGPLSIAVPGAVDGWLELHNKYGTKDLERLSADAVALARDGFPISLELAESIDERETVEPRVVGEYITIRRDQRAQVIAKIDIDRRAVVQCTNAYPKDMSGSFRRFICQSAYEVRM